MTNTEVCWAHPSLAGRSSYYFCVPCWELWFVQLLVLWSFRSVRRGTRGSTKHLDFKELWRLLVKNINVNFEQLYKCWYCWSAWLEGVGLVASKKPFFMFLCLCLGLLTYSRLHIFNVFNSSTSLLVCMHYVSKLLVVLFFYYCF